MVSKHPKLYMLLPSYAHLRSKHSKSQAPNSAFQSAHIDIRPIQKLNFSPPPSSRQLPHFIPQLLPRLRIMQIRAHWPSASSTTARLTSAHMPTKNHDVGVVGPQKPHYPRRGPDLGVPPEEVEEAHGMNDGHLPLECVQTLTVLVALQEEVADDESRLQLIPIPEQLVPSLHEPLLHVDAVQPARVGPVERELPQHLAHAAPDVEERGVGPRPLQPPERIPVVRIRRELQREEPEVADADVRVDLPQLVALRYAGISTPSQWPIITMNT